MTPSALPVNELRSYAGHPTHRRTSPVALSPDRRHRPGTLDRALAVARTLLAIFASRADSVLEHLALRQQFAVLNEKRLQRLLACFASYDLDARTRLCLKKDPPAMRAGETKPEPAAEVIALPRLGGLHHRYAWRRAA